jgi:hypothetical protein
LSRDIEVTDVRVGVNGAAPDSVSQFCGIPPIVNAAIAPW